jgi:hypothetical protein
VQRQDSILKSAPGISFTQRRSHVCESDQKKKEREREREKKRKRRLTNGKIVNFPYSPFSTQLHTYTINQSINQSINHDDHSAATTAETRSK